MSPELYDDLAVLLDPTLMAESAGIVPDPWQCEVLRSPAKRLLLNASRQSGKSLVTAILALHTAISAPESLVLLFSPTLRQSSELFKAMIGVWAALGKPMPIESETLLRLELGNGSRVMSLPGTERTVRGLSRVKLIICDEAARIPDELFLSILPMLAVSDGRLVLLSTPWGNRGFFYQCYANRLKEGFAYWEIPADSCPRISREFLESQRRLMGSYWYQSEYECKFLQSEGAVFSPQAIAGIQDNEVEVWNDLVMQPPVPTNTSSLVKYENLWSLG